MENSIYIISFKKYVRAMIYFYTPCNKVARDMMYLTRPSVSQSVCKSCVFASTTPS